MEEPGKAAPANSAGSGKHMAHAVDLLADEPLPLSIGRWAVCPTDGIRRETASSALVFHFNFAGYAFKCQLDAGENPRLVLTAAFGRLPFTVESPEARRLLSSLLGLAGQLPSGRLQQAEDGAITMEAAKAVPAPARPSGIVAAVTALLLEFKPWLPLLQETLPPKAAIPHPLAPVKAAAPVRASAA